MTTAPADALSLLDLGCTAATAYGRPDLADRLVAAKRRMASPHVCVLVIGEFKHGKSSLVNALLGRTLCPVDDDLATALPTAIRWAREPVATLWREDGSGLRTGETLPFGELPRHITETSDPCGDAGERTIVEIGFPHPLLADGLTLIDTPGSGGLAGLHTARTMGALHMAEAVVFVCDGGREFTATELALLASVAEVCPQILLVTTKVDIHPEWRRMRDANRAHAAALGLDLPAMGVSAALCDLAWRRRDEGLYTEAGFVELRRWLCERVVDGASSRTAQAAATEVGEVAAVLAEQLGLEQAALADPAASTALVHELERAQDRAAAFRGSGSRWQQVMADAFADASTDIEHDLRDRLRALVADAEHRIDQIDPAKAWTEFAPWLSSQLSTAAAEHTAFRHRRLVECASRVEVVFGEDEHGLEQLLAAAPLGASPAELAFDRGPRQHTSQVLTLLRSSYSGLAMFGFFGGLTGVVLALPVMAGLGLVLGGKGLRDERSRQLAQRRTQARASVRRYLDDASYLLTKDTRDTLRMAQRDLRDHFAGRAATMQQTIVEALTAAERALAFDDEQRSGRLADIGAELERIDRLSRRAHLMAEGAVAR